MSARTVTKKIFLFLNIAAVIVFGLACIARYLNPERWWAISLLSLGFAFIIITLFVFFFFWLFFKPKYSLISLIPLLLGYKAILLFFAFNTGKPFDYDKPSDVLRVVHWNVGRFVEWKRNNNKGSQTRLKMMDLLKEQNADVLCLQEFFHSRDKTYYDNLNHVMQKLGYPYYYYSWDNDGALQWSGQIIFSRHRILDSGIIRFPRPSMPESLIQADILFNGDTIRFYTTHLQSVQFKKKDFETIEGITDPEEGTPNTVENSKNIFSKLRKGVILRAAQARVVRDVISTCPHPFVLTGDFNDVPNSYTYSAIRGEKLQDAFLEKGFGVGRTYSYIAPTLRIDYLLTTKNFSIEQFNRVVKDYSDHYLLVADLKAKK